MPEQPRKMAGPAIYRHEVPAWNEKVCFFHRQFHNLIKCLLWRFERYESHLRYFLTK